MSLSDRPTQNYQNGNHQNRKLEEIEIPVSELPTLLMPDAAEQEAQSELPNANLFAKEQIGDDLGQPETAGKSPLAGPTEQPRAKGMSLRNQLLTTLLPVTLIPLVATGFVASSITYQNSYQRGLEAVRARTINNADYVGKAVLRNLEVISIVATNPLVIEAAQAGSSQAGSLAGQPTAELEKRYAGTKLLQSNPILNDYLVRVADKAGLAEVFFTSKQGFNVAYSNPTSDFYQGDEKWWQIAKENGVYVRDPEPDASARVAAGIELNLAIRDPKTDQVVGVIKGVYNSSSLDDALVNRLQQLNQTLGGSGDKTMQLLSSENAVFRTLNQDGPQDSTELIGGDTVLKEINKFRESFAANPDVSEVLTAPIFVHAGKEFELSRIPGTNWVAVLSIEEADLGEAGRNLSLVFIILTPILAAVAATAIILLARRVSQPLNTLAVAAEQVAEGNLDVQAEVKGAAESQTLALSFNNLVERVKTLLQSQEQAAKEQLAAQSAITEQQMANARKELEAKEFLQNRALELLIEVGPLRRGDLTIRANVTEDEIGTIADSYNATIESLRKLVRQVQLAAGEVSQTADSNEVSVQALTADAVQQSQAMQAALKQIAQMTKSIQTVAQSAQSAEQAVQLASQTVSEGDIAMNRTVEGILTIRETVADTAKKVKQLGESSQKISKVVSLIGGFASQTNLLALNASIEAAHAGEEGRGFAVVADEVRSLARQSAKATAEIEQLVANIQTETNEVVTAMEAGTQQVVAGTQLVEETRQSLAKVAQASDQITALVQAIAQAAVSQTQASSLVSETITDVAGIADNTSTRATQVLGSFQDLLKVAQDLQATVSQFKLS
ncbi:MAG: HAMP domain-containing protein [Aphanocapsa sp. GSE-SYN-MK-11-07L]|jgi:twitching motility protein PilJ|nr:HAMP domain-containing protein [Aphanocapsa sp. GSE-SYN-MK-11-07L]